jgi:hypothetical protein
MASATPMHQIWTIASSYLGLPWMTISDRGDGNPIFCNWKTSIFGIFWPFSIFSKSHDPLTRKEVRDHNYFWLVTYPYIGLPSIKISAPGSYTSKRYNCILFFFGLILAYAFSGQPSRGRTHRGKVAPPNVFWVGSSPKLVDENKRFWGSGAAGPRVANLSK